METRLSEAAGRSLRRHLQRGGLVAYPTESSYGLGCLPGHARALVRLMRLKKRPQHKGMIVIGAGVGQLQPWLAALPPDTAGRLAQIWPARQTFLLAAGRRVLPALRGRGRDVLAVRVPDHAAARVLCRRAGSALVSTSCNRAGKRPCRSEREVRRQFGRQVKIVGGRTGGAKRPSEIVDWRSGMRLR
ncbi:L-threonylcarbamoyladenylate synthase [Neisseria leonii]|uniref:Threonylcarbamoyl-AMP synthase n=1 Tax=Neisseria leonii TaxID=2995413 RepID=A0A9X4IBM7_9NEIS|nr:L-threonylcarbamoyladenylate synthase [Neisseria sp. 51.81]MDD9328585.1 L-threonylcarbamoyladenylate synthase [Neisseria sp. 51.81]